MALLWKPRGLWTKTILTSFGQVSRICLKVGPTFEQYGHWKSLDSTIVILP